MYTYKRLQRIKPELWCKLNQNAIKQNIPTHKYMIKHCTYRENHWIIDWPRELGHLRGSTKSESHFGLVQVLFFAPTVSCIGPNSRPQNLGLGQGLKSFGPVSCIPPQEPAIYRYTCTAGQERNAVCS